MIKKNVWTVVLGSYAICWLFRVIEYLVIRTDRIIIGEAFLHKLVGILVLGICLHLFHRKWSAIGFSAEGFGRNTLFGLLLGVATFGVAYGVEYFQAAQSQASVKLAYFITAYSAEGNIGTQTGPLFLLICIIGNLINVVMEEGIFRGLYVKVLEQKYSFMGAAFISSGLFGIWHIAAPLRSYLDGERSLTSFLLSSLVQILLTGIMGVQLCLLVKITGSLWASMAVHFVNNFVVNVLHVVTASGTDAMQSLRITIAQTVSFLIVLVIFIIQKSYQRKTFRN